MGRAGQNSQKSEEARIARFWADGHRTATPPGHWNAIARNVTQNLSPDDRLDILLALNIALYDTGIATWDAKYHYNFWRPQTAILKAKTDGNIGTRPLSNWFSYLDNPYHPEYVSGHSAFSAAAATVLSNMLGEVDFCTISEGTATDKERCFSSFWAAAEEAGKSRIYGGIHFSFSNEDGFELGKNVAN